MESVPGAIATGSQLIARIEICEDGYPVATAPGTDLILKLGHCPAASQLSSGKVFFLWRSQNESSG